MANSLQDQLLKAGLVSEEQLKNAKKPKPKQHKKSKKKAKAKPELTEAQLAVQKAEQEKRERDRALEDEKKKRQQQRDIDLKINRLVKHNQVEHGQGDLTFSFVAKEKVKKIYVDDDQHHKLVSGKLGIVRSPNGIALVPADVAELIRECDEKALYLLNKPGEEGKENAIDDEYAGFEVPDDLMW